MISGDEILDAMKVPYEILSDNEADLPSQFDKAYNMA